MWPTGSSRFSTCVSKVAWLSSHQTVGHGSVLSFAFARGEYLAGGLLGLNLSGSIRVVFLSERCCCFAISYRVHNGGGAGAGSYRAMRFLCKDGVSDFV